MKKFADKLKEGVAVIDNILPVWKRKSPSKK